MGSTIKTTVEPRKLPVVEAVKNMDFEEISKETKINAWKSRLYAPELNQGWEQVKGQLEKTRHKLEKTCGENFVTLQLWGSWSKGYAKVRGFDISDMDLAVYVKGSGKEEGERARKIIEEDFGKEFKIDFYLIDLSELRRECRELRITKENESMMEVKHVIANIEGLFGGVQFGDEKTVSNARRELLRDISKNPQGEVIWEKVREMHTFFDVELIKLHSVGLRPIYVPPNHIKSLVEYNLGVSVKEYEEIVEARRNMSLPNLKEMMRKCGL